MMCARRGFQQGGEISLLHCEFMRQALGSGGVQSAGARYHRMSLVARESLGGGEQEKKKAGSARLVFGGWEALGLFIRERERRSDCPVVQCCKEHEPKSTQYIDSAASAREHTQSQPELALLSGLISCVHSSYLRLKAITPLLGSVPIMGCAL